MYSLKTPSFLRPASRPSSPTLPHPPSSLSSDRAPRPSMLSFSSFKRSASPLTTQPTNITQDGSYMEVLNLKLSEAVSKALAQPPGPPLPTELINGRRPIPPGRGTILGNIIASEIKASRENPYLYRAVLRTLHRPLSVLVTNLSANLLPLLSSPDFLFPVSPSQQGCHLNSVQLHAIGLANLAGELLHTFDHLGLGLDGDMRGDGLKVIRDALVSVVKRVLDPLVTGIKKDLMPHIEALEFTNPTSVSSHGSSVKTPGSTRAIQHSSIVFLQGAIPAYSRTLARLITTPTAESSLATLLISLIWRGLVALSSRPFPPASPPTSPALPPILSRGRDARVSGGPITPPTTPPASRFALKLPPSQPASSNGAPANKIPSASADARSLYDLLSSLPRPKGENGSRQLAQEVVDEAFEALAALPALLETAQAAYRGKSKISVTKLENEMEVLTADVPTLIALPVLLRAYVFPHLPNAITPDRTVSSMLGLGEAAYRSGCLSGFGREEECTAVVGQRVLDVVRGGLRCPCDAKVDMCVDRDVVGEFKEVDVVLKWLGKQVSVAAVQH